MIPNKLKILHVEFYITNVCNLSCHECRSFNNLKLKGWDNWNDYKKVYEEWSKILDITTSFNINGGEPLLNPTFYEWVEGLIKLWPNTKCQINTNGTRLDSKLYEICKKYKDNLVLIIACHNSEWLEEFKDNIRKFLANIVDERFEHIRTGNDHWFRDSNGVSVRLNEAWSFKKNALKINDKGRYTLYNSDPYKAHVTCHNRFCHQFIKGKLFKCVPSALFNILDQQYNLDLSDQDRKMIQDFEGLTLDSSFTEKVDWISKINDPISLCKFCPTTLKKYDASAMLK